GGHRWRSGNPGRRRPAGCDGARTGCRAARPSTVARQARAARQLDGEGGALARLAPDVDVAAMRLHDVPADEQTQPEPALRRATAAPLEAAEQPRHVLGRDA